MRQITLTPTLCLAMAISAQAQEVPEGFSVGIGIGAGNSAYLGEDDVANLLPIVRYDSAAFSVGLPQGLRLTVLDRNDFRLSAVVSPRLSEIDNADADVLDGLDREITIDGGLRMTYSLSPQTRLTFGAVTELTDEHDGQEVSVGVTQILRAGSLPVILGAGARWQSSDLGRYLYGVRASEVTATRPEYTPDDAILPYISIGSLMPVSDTVRLTANLRADFLPETVTDSPIIDEDVKVGFLVGVIYNF